MKRYSAYVVPVVIGLLRIVVWLLRYALFAVMMFLRPVVGLLFGTAAALCLAGLLFGLVVARDQPHMLWAFLAAGVLSGVIRYAYDVLVLALAPDRFPLLLAR